MPAPDIDRLFHEGVTALRAEDKKTAREKLTQVIELDRTHEQGWLWLSAAVDNRDEQLICLDNVLTINPHNEVARKALIKLGGVPPELPETEETPPEAAPPLLEHAPMRILEDRATEKFRDVTEQAAEDPWKVLGEEGYTIDATRVSTPRELEDRSFTDLVMAWGQLFIFSPHGDFAAELANPHIGHIFINLAFASFFSIAAGVIGFAISLQVAAQRLPAFLEQLGAALSTVEGSATDAGVPELLTEGSTDPAAELLNLFAEFTTQVQDELGARIWLWLLGFAISVVVLVFIGQFVRGFAASWVSRFVNGKGDVVVTTHALTMALVVTQFAQVPLFIIYPFLPLGGIISIGWIYAIYAWAVNGFALGHAQRYNTLVGMGMILAANFVLQALGAGIFILFSFLLAL